MQDIDSTYEGDLAVAQRPRSPRRRLILLSALLLPLLLIVLIVPLINISRFQRRIVTSLSESLGRPIHLDSISLALFPLPGLTIENLVVAEDPAFGNEPFVRASSVRATLRLSSLWRRRIEFSRISLTDPSINLVRVAEGKWNLDSILLQAARIEAAPTAQLRASATPRFPYIEATGARLNLKLDQEKTPISLTDASFALWLNTPQEWKLRLEGRPLRTDTNVTDTGTLRLQGTLGRAATLNDMPMDLDAEWQDAPLGDATRVMFGQDAGLRGFMTLAVVARGTVGQSTVSSTLHLANLRRADFLPDQTLTLDAECQGIQMLAFRSLTDLRCSWPPALTTVNQPRTLALTASLPDTRHLSSSSLDLGTPGIPAATILGWSRIAGKGISPDITATGTVTGGITYRPATKWDGQITVNNGTLTVPSVSKTPVFSGTLALHLVPSAQGAQFVFTPVPLELGGADFATIEGRIDKTGYSLHFTGTSAPAKLHALGAALPQLGEGLAEILPPASSTALFRFDLLTANTWGGMQVWHPNLHPATAPPRHRHKR